MDYTYAAGLENNTQILAVAHPFLSSTPSEDFVIPGSANLIHMYPTIVPIFGRNPTTIEKKVDDLTGQGGKDKNEPTHSNNEERSIDSKIIPGQNLNVEEPETSTSISRKRTLPDGILDSFLHPKLLKTETIKVELARKKPAPFKSVIQKKTSEKHKFNVVE